jgi:RimJ/RimL family protein N-acetyltransferase
LEFDAAGNFVEGVVRTKDGVEVLIRPAVASDREALERMFRSCSADTLYTRFLSPGLGVPLRYLNRLMAHNPPATMALVAEVQENDQRRIIALMNFIETAPGEAGEIAIIVHDDYQNRGLGRLMTACLQDLARARGVKKFIADVDAGNRRVFHLIKRSGLPSQIVIDQGIAHVEMQVRP